MKAQAGAVDRSPGVRAGSALREVGQEPERSAVARGCAPRSSRECITGEAAAAEVGGGRGSEEVGEHRWSDGPLPAECGANDEENRLQGTATTEDAREDGDRPWVETGVFVPKIAALRAKLYGKAKREPGFRFYSLYGQILRRDVLREAWEQVAENNGAPGVDGVSIAEVLDRPAGRELLLEEIERELRSRSYRPSAVRRVMIPKSNGKLRPLGIPTVKDRVVQTAVKMVLEPIFEADFLECSHGFRPGRSAQDALRQIWENVRAGRVEAYDADLSSYFDTIPHDQLMACVERRIADGSILRLIRAWLQAEVEERDEDGGPPRRHRPQAGTPQGGVISPLLANLYLHWFDKLFHRADGPRWWANARLVRYADDFVILARHVGERIRAWVEGTLEGRFQLKINREKTAIRRVTADSGQALDFLGYRTWYAPGYLRPGRYLTANPSPKAMAAARGALRGIISRKFSWMTPTDLVERVNAYTTGWAAYHRHGRPAHQYWALNAFIADALRRHLERRSQRPYRPPAGVTWWRHLVDDLDWTPLPTAPVTA